MPPLDPQAAAALLEGLEGAEREERAELLAWLATEHGATAEELQRATERGTIVLLAASRALGGGDRLSARDVAAASGMDVDLYLALGRANGLPVPQDLDAPEYGDVDVEAARSGQAFLDAGLQPEQLVATSRVLGRGLSATAETMRQIVTELSITPNSSEQQHAAAYAAIAETLTPMVGPLVEQMLRIHLDHAIREEVVTADERRAGELPGARELNVAFADLVGFTRMGEELGPGELERVAERLVQLTAEVVEPPVRFVKSVGDAVLLVSPVPGPLVSVAFALMAAAEAEGEDFPQLRVGLAQGAAVARAGDVFGRPVNLASRITTVARAGSVVTDARIRKAVGEDDVRWSSAGERKLKGVAAPVKLHRARPPQTPSS